MAHFTDLEELTPPHCRVSKTNNTQGSLGVFFGDNQTTSSYLTIVSITCTLQLFEINGNFEVLGKRTFLINIFRVVSNIFRVVSNGFVQNMPVKR